MLFWLERCICLSVENVEGAEGGVFIPRPQQTMSRICSMLDNTCWCLQNMLTQSTFSNFAEFSMITLAITVILAIVVDPTRSFEKLRQISKYLIT